MRKTLVRLTVVLTAGLVAAGCGTSGSNSTSAQKETTSPQQVVNAAYEKTTATKTARVSAVTKVEASASGSSQSTQVKSDGVVDFTDGAVSMTTHLPNGSAIEMRMINDVIYIHLPAQLAKTSGKPWVKITPQDIKAQTGINLQQLNEMSNHDPAKVLAYLKGASDKVSKAGTATVRGVKTTKYEATIDLNKVAAKNPAAKQAIQKAEQQLGTSTLPMSIWIDSQGRTRRMQWTIPVPAQNGQTQKGKASVTEEFYDFGVTAHIAPPPADQTMPIREMSK